MPLQSRRAFLSGASAVGASLALAGCVSTQAVMAPVATPLAPIDPGEPLEPVTRAPLDSAGAVEVGGRLDFASIYGPVGGEPFPVPAIDLRKVNHAFLRAEVAYNSAEEPGTIIIDPSAHYLYHVQPGGRAVRYGVGVGREGFGWSGTATINSKQTWPDWYPPKEMIARQPEIAAKMAKLQSGVGMHGGPGNPLGARAMYLWQNRKDTLYRIHGTVEPWTIGKSVSSGCIRMINQDVMNLYESVPIGTKVVVLAAGESAGL